MGRRYTQLLITRWVWASLFVWGFHLLSAQAQTSVSFGPVGFVYTGDLNERPNLRQMRGGFQLGFHYPLSHTFALNIHTGMGSLAGSESEQPDALGIQRQHTFQRLLTELYGTIRFNFIPPVSHAFMPEPYIFVGTGLLITQAARIEGKKIAPLQPILPFGVGLKCPLNKGRSMALIFDLCFKKTFFDYLDYLSEGNSTTKNFRYGDGYSNDWYHSFQIGLAFAIRGIPCPFPPSDE